MSIKSIKARATHDVEFELAQDSALVRELVKTSGMIGEDKDLLQAYLDQFAADMKSIGHMSPDTIKTLKSKRKKVLTFIFNEPNQDYGHITMSESLIYAWACGKKKIGEKSSVNGKKATRENAVKAIEALMKKYSRVLSKTQKDMLADIEKQLTK